MKSRWTSLFAAALVFATPLASYAAPRDAATAEALFREGRSAMKRQDYETACAKFAESQRLDPAPGTVLNLAQCEENRGQFASAWQHYQEAADQIPMGDARRKVAQAGIASTAPRVPKVIVRLPADAPDGAVVKRDGTALGPASFDTALPVDPGEHTIVATAPGRREAITTVQARPGETVEVVVEFGAPLDANRAEGSQSSASEKHTSTTAGTGSGRTLGYVLGAAGVVGLGVGTYFALGAKSKDDDAIKAGCSGTTCPTQDGIDLTNESRDRAKYATVGFVAGGAALVGGIVLVLTAPPAGEGGGTSRGLVVRTALAPGVVGVTADGVW